ncbi:MAG: DUF922 domain-containing protein [Bacteroidetes bacterium]|nr:DUF922 domain-containing protein [Bacteroidota bacterium]
MSLNGFDIRISWFQFREVSQRPVGVNEDAEISIEPYLSFRTRNNNGIIEIIDVNTTISVSRSRSWVRTGCKTDWLLNHEQGHFDIAVLGMREMYNSLLSLRRSPTSEFNRETIRIQTEIQRKIDEADHLYDTQTNHGLNSAEQIRWSSRIRTLKGSSAGVLNDLR